MKWREVLFYGIICITLFTADQFVKILIIQKLEIEETVHLLPFFSLHHTENTGVAFSMFTDVSKEFLIAFSIGIIAFILFLAWQTPSLMMRIGFSFILGGACGNLADRIIHGHVIDYFAFHTPIWAFAVFNLADSFITIGAALIVLQEIQSRWKSKSTCLE